VLCVVLLQESEAVELASKLEDKGWALEKLLGPTLQPEGSTNRLMSEEAKALTEHLYTPDRWACVPGLASLWCCVCLGRRQR
jgi:hypothetical protein